MAQGRTKRILKIGISLLYLSAENLYRFTQKILGGDAKRRLVILYYHAVPERHRSRFARQMESLNRGANVVPASYRGPLRADRCNVAITFDDAFVSVAENALPELASRRFHATVFVPTGLLGRGPTWAMETGNLDANETVMSSDQLKMLKSDLVTLGSHTVTHPRLSKLPLPDARTEIEDSRAALQQVTSQDVRTFSFPYGDYAPSTLELCRAAGFDQVFSIRPEPVDPESSTFVRGRVKVEPFDGQLEFFLKYHGAYAWIVHASALKQKVRAALKGFGGGLSSLRLGDEPNRKNVH